MLKSIARWFVHHTSEGFRDVRYTDSDLLKETTSSNDDSSSVEGSGISDSEQYLSK